MSVQYGYGTTLDNKKVYGAFGIQASIDGKDAYYIITDQNVLVSIKADSFIPEGSEGKDNILQSNCQKTYLFFGGIGVEFVTNNIAQVIRRLKTEFPLRIEIWSNGSKIKDLYFEDLYNKTKEQIKEMLKYPELK